MPTNNQTTHVGALNQDTHLAVTNTWRWQINGRTASSVQVADLLLDADTDVRCCGGVFIEDARAHAERAHRASRDLRARAFALDATGVLADLAAIS